jgi:hypothetical protein
MRIPILAVLFGCTAFGGAAAAADLRAVPRGAIFAPAGQIIEWDFEPGVVVRAYWLPPYAGRHYFPTSGTAPQVGRKENLESSVKPEPAKSFHREWSSSPVDFGGPAPLMGPLPADASNEPSLK